MSRKLIGRLRATSLADPASPCVLIDGIKTTPAFRDKNTDLFSSIRVYRATVEGFEFGNDYDEFFDGIPVEEARLIYEGPGSLYNEREFTYHDREVAYGKVYCYWMGGRHGELTGPVAVKVRDPLVWWPYDRVVEYCRSLEKTYPNAVRVSRIGASVKGKPILELRAGTGQRTVSVIGAVHAGEAGAELSLGATRILLETDRRLLDRVALSIVPVLNIDEREREVEGVPWYIRKNASGVDLNRNFPVDWDHTELGYGLDSTDPYSDTYRGPYPESEPETRAIVAYLRELAPEAVLSYHCLASICGAGLISARDAAADDVYAARCRSIANAFIEGTGIAVPQERYCSFVCTSGSLPAWCWNELGIPAFDLEISPETEKEAYEKCRRDRTDRALLTEYQTLHARGLWSVLKTIATS